MFSGNPIVPLPCSQTPAGPRRLAFPALGCCSRCSDDESSSDLIISRLYDMASALALYASCRPLGRLRKTRFRGWPAFPGWDSSVPTEFL